MNTSIQEFDDLTVITGIGDSIQKRLRSSLYVKSYNDLATIPVDTIESNLKSDKVIPAPLKTRKKIEIMVAEAKTLSKLENAQTTMEQEEWEPVDSFVIEFQRKKNVQGEMDLRAAVQHVEHDTNSHWDFRKDQERENLFKWMESEANLDQIQKEQKAEDTEPTNSTHAIVEEIMDFSWQNDVKPTQISLTLGEETATTSEIDKEKRPFLAHISHEQPLDLEVTFALPFTPTTGDNSLRYNAQCQIHNLSQGKKPSYMQMDTAENFGDEPSISAKLSGISLEPGIYELGILVRGERPLGANFYEFPKLNVL